MVTKGIILSQSPNSGGYKWRVYIPTLVGLPDSAEESKLFRLYREQQDKLRQSQQEKQPNSVLERFLIALRGKVQAQKPIELSDDILRYVIDAEVCSLCGTKVDYQNGDIVIVGFIDNEMSSPIILGTYMTEMLAENRITRPQIKAESLSVDKSAQLPLSTSIKAPDGGNITVQQIYDALQFINRLQERGLSLDTVTQIINVVSPPGGQGIMSLFRNLETVVGGLTPQ